MYNQNQTNNIHFQCIIPSWINKYYMYYETKRIPYSTSITPKQIDKAYDLPGSVVAPKEERPSFPWRDQIGATKMHRLTLEHGLLRGGTVVVFRGFPDGWMSQIRENLGNPLGTSWEHNTVVPISFVQSDLRTCVIRACFHPLKMFPFLVPSNFNI